MKRLLLTNLTYEKTSLLIPSTARQQYFYTHWSNTEFSYTISLYRSVFTPNIGRSQSLRTPILVGQSLHKTMASNNGVPVFSDLVLVFCSLLIHNSVVSQFIILITFQTQFRSTKSIFIPYICVQQSFHCQNPQNWSFLIQYWSTTVLLYSISVYLLKNTVFNAQYRSTTVFSYSILVNQCLFTLNIYQQPTFQIQNWCSKIFSYPILVNHSLLISNICVPQSFQKQ